MDCNRLGDLTELRAVIWLWEQGYEVFKNLSGVGPIDLLTVNKFTGEVVFIDVKYRDGNKAFGRLKDEQENIKVRVLNVSNERIWWNKEPIPTI